MNTYNLLISIWDKKKRILNFLETERIAENEEQAKESFLNDFEYIKERAIINIYKVIKL